MTRIVKGYRRPEWQKNRERNEALDCRVYARAAAAVCGIDRMTDADWQALEQRMAQAGQAPQPQAPAQRRIRYRFGVDWIDPERTKNWLDR